MCRFEASTSSMEYIYVYGGQTLGGFEHTLLRYRISTDLWEDLGIREDLGGFADSKRCHDLLGHAAVWSSIFDSADVWLLRSADLRIS